MERLIFKIMKGNLLLLFSLVTLNLATPGYLVAENPASISTNKEDLKLIKLQEKVDRTQNKVNATKAKLELADSLIRSGAILEKEAKKEIKKIRAEEKKYIKTKNDERKVLWKQYKESKKDDVRVIEDEVKELDYQFKAQLRQFYKRYTAEERKLKKAEKNSQKGKYKRKLYEPRLKDYQNTLKIAKANLEKYKAEKNL